MGCLLVILVIFASAVVLLWDLLRSFGPAIVAFGMIAVLFVVIHFVADYEHKRVGGPWYRGEKKDGK